MKKIDKVSISSIIRKILLSISTVFICVFFLNLLHGFMWFLETLSFQLFFDSISSFIKHNDLGKVLVMGGLVAVVSISIQIVNGITNFVNASIFYKKVSEKLLLMIHQKADALNYIEYYKTSSLERIEKVKSVVPNFVTIVRVLLSIFTFNIPYQLIMAIYLYDKSPSLLIIYPTLLIPLLVSQFLSLKSRKHSEPEYVEFEHEARYFKNCMIAKEYVMETSLLNAKEFFTKKFSNSMTKYKKTYQNTEKSVFRKNIFLQLLTSLGFVIIIALLTFNISNGTISVGEFFAIFMSLNSLYRFMDNMVSRDIGNVIKNSNRVESLIKFFNLQEMDYSKQAEVDNRKRSIILRNVSFSYPQASKNSLSHINLTISEGESIAIVGENGSGKTTLSKIILGVFQPTQGVIKSEFFISDISVVLQDFIKYKMSILDNIIIGDTADRIDILKARNLLERLDFNLDNFSDGLETQLGREFGGVDLSGGQWQKLAITRGLSRERPLSILDEPTSAIDPIMEEKILSLFKSEFQTNGGLIITHRIGAAQLADKILVMDNGSIVEQGSHSELIKLRGKYYSLYTTQAKWYS